MLGGYSLNLCIVLLYSVIFIIKAQLYIRDYLLLISCPTACFYNEILHNILIYMDFLFSYLDWYLFLNFAFLNIIAVKHYRYV